MIPRDPKVSVRKNNSKTLTCEPSSLLQDVQTNSVKPSSHGGDVADVARGRWHRDPSSCSESGIFCPGRSSSAKSLTLSVANLHFSLISETDSSSTHMHVPPSETGCSPSAQGESGTSPSAQGGACVGQRPHFPLEIHSHPPSSAHAFSHRHALGCVSSWS